MVDTIILPSNQCIAIDNPVRGFIWTVLEYDLRRTHEYRNRNNSLVCDKGNSERKQIHAKKIQRVLSFLTILIL